VDSVSFDRIAGRYDESRGGRARARLVAAGVEPHLVEGPVLEVGVGTGAVAEALRELGHEVVGVDLSREMLRRAFDRLGASVAQGDAHRLPARSRGVPNVLFVWVLHLVGDPIAVLGEARRVLREGGRVIVVTNAVGTAGNDLEPIIDGLRAALGRHALTSDHVVAMAGAAGLTALASGSSAERTYLDSPVDAALSIERRTYSYVWDLDADTWERVVEPAVTALRALPDPDRGRPRSSRQDVTVLAAR
jgi:SAM-dependent methyltransferase